ncbi:hypothetical protein K439DRAFT_1016836 [Ramaria rubella]|nr:hypothetical protein K439DRAFT_1016836 [Ramaria rubella]
MAKCTTTSAAARPGRVRACAECRRLKLRCDRKFPCQACIRRGCHALCPDKCFTDEATPSSLKASSLRNREEIQSLKDRVALLEEALLVANPSHPLLTHRDSPVSTRSSPFDSSSSTNGHEASLEETIDIFGALSMGENGSLVYHGATSLSENFVQTTPEATDRLNIISGQQPILPSSLQLLSILFPFAPQTISANSDINELLPYLPPFVDTLEITNRYWHEFSLGSSPIFRQQFMKNVYDHFYPRNIIKTHLERSDAHRLGVLFITLALGVLSDIDQPIMPTQAQMYYQLARASLSLDPIYDNTTIHSLQCMISLSCYMRSAPARTSAGYLWAFNGIILKLASSIGIFRDSRKWLTDVDEIEQREVICWELICMETWQAFSTGRPCSIDLSLVDCGKPPESATPTEQLSGFIFGYTDWRYRFIPLINNVLLVVQRPGPVKYNEILKAEKELRECPMPDGLRVPALCTPDVGLPDDAVTKHVQRFSALIIRESACCLLHRRFLVLAMQHDSDDPRRNQFWYSAYQAGHSATWIVKAFCQVYRKHPKFISRVPGYWSMSFSAAVILGAIAARYWNRDFAQGTLRPFEEICALFKETAETSIQPLNAWEVLQRLQQRVRAHLSTSKDDVPSFNDLSLLGAQPLAKVPAPSQAPTQYRMEADTASPGVTFKAVANPTLCSEQEQPSFSMAESTTKIFPLEVNTQGGETLWSVPDLGLFYDSTGCEMQVAAACQWPEVPQEWEPSLFEGMGNAPVEDFVAVAEPSDDAEVGQWNHFLNRLGVWE